MAAGYQIAINFNGPDSAAIGGRGSSADFLSQVLTKLNSAVDKLVNVLNKQMYYGGGGAGPAIGGEQTNSPETNSQKIRSLLTGGTIAAIAVTTLRWMNANAGAILAQSGNRGAFAAAGVLGQANQTFGSYAGNFYDIERKREIARNSAIGQGLGGFGGGLLGLGLGAATGNPLAAAKGAAAGAGFGAAVGDYATTRLVNANVEQAMLIEKAWAQRAANASLSEWQTGFSRFGMARENLTIAGSNITGGASLSVPLSQAFEKKFGTINGAFNPNYNAILNNIAPYLQTNPLDSGKTGDLNKVSENFQKAGFAVNQFAELTIQGSQYQALTGRNLQQFSEDVKSARSKFGDVYDISSNQTALNLMAMGYSANEAQSIAFQSRYNSGIMGNVGEFTSLTPQGYYSSLALSRPLGFDLFNTLKTGQFQGGNAQRKKLLQQLKTAENGGGLSTELMLLNSQGYSLGQIGQWLQPKVSSLKGAVNEATAFSPAQTQAMKDLTDGIRNALNNVGSMVVNATNVQIVNQNPGTLQSNFESAYSMGHQLGKGHDKYHLPPLAWNWMEGRRAIKKS